jgi:hypothetical protein
VRGVADQPPQVYARGVQVASVLEHVAHHPDDITAGAAAGVRIPFPRRVPVRISEEPDLFLKGFILSANQLEARRRL